MKKKVLVCGAGGFIGGHLVSNLIKDNKFEIICADIKPLNYWFQYFSETVSSGSTAPSTVGTVSETNGTSLNTVVPAIYLQVQ